MRSLAPLLEGEVPAETHALILYDTTGPWGWLGEAYATMTANLASHFGAWTAKPVTTYTAGEVEQYTATIYIGSTYDEPLPPEFLDDVYATSRPVIWMSSNIWQLSNRFPEFRDTYGWIWNVFDTSPVAEVVYKGTGLSRYAANASGIMTYSVIDPDVQVLAEACGKDATTVSLGTAFPAIGPEPHLPW